MLSYCFWAFFDFQKLQLLQFDGKRATNGFFKIFSFVNDMMVSPCFQHDRCNTSLASAFAPREKNKNTPAQHGPESESSIFSTNMCDRQIEGHQFLTTLSSIQVSTDSRSLISPGIKPPTPSSATQLSLRYDAALSETLSIRQINLFFFSVVPMSICRVPHLKVITNLRTRAPCNLPKSQGAPYLSGLWPQCNRSIEEVNWKERSCFWPRVTPIMPTMSLSVKSP